MAVQKPIPNKNAEENVWGVSNPNINFWGVRTLQQIECIRLNLKNASSFKLPLAWLIEKRNVYFTAVSVTTFPVCSADCDYVAVRTFPIHPIIFAVFTR